MDGKLIFDLGPLDPEYDLGTLDTLPQHFDINHEGADPSTGRVVWETEDGKQVVRREDAEEQE